MDGRTAPRRSNPRTPGWRVVSAGVGVVAVSYGLARYGYGLLLPDMRNAFGLSSAKLGLIASTAYASYLLAVASAGALTARHGARLVVVAGGVLAVVGMIVIALAPNGLVLAAGVFIAGASGGLVFPPFADVVADLLEHRSRSRAIATISSGTGWGVLAAVPIALLAGALLIGLAASVYWTFAVDLADQAGLGRDGARLLLGVVGAASLAGSLGGDLLERFGGRAALVLTALLMATALALLASAASGWLGAVLSAAGFGAAYSLIVALQTIWSARVFADRPAVGLGAVMFVLSVGLLAGPPVAGAFADQVSLPAAFYAAACMCAATVFLTPREELRASVPARS